jgi:sec-independent protein translocase protein TatB
MFDIGFSELLVIAVVALIVIGPQQLPRVARTLGHLFGRMQRYVNDVKADITREMELDELKKMRTSMEDAASSFRSSVDKEVRAAESELSKMEQDAQSAVDGFSGTGAMPTEQPALAAEKGEPAPESKPDPESKQPSPESKPQPPAPKQA